MENRRNCNAQRAKRNRAKAKAELQKLKAFNAFMFNKYPKQVWEFERLHQAISGEQNKEEAEAAVAEAVLNFPVHASKVKAKE